MQRPLLKNKQDKVVNLMVREGIAGLFSEIPFFDTKEEFNDEMGHI